MVTNKPGRCRFYPLTGIVWDTDMGISGTKPYDSNTYPELLFSCSGHHLVIGSVNHNEFLSVSLENLAFDENISIKKQVGSALYIEGRTEAIINGILAVPNGHILCLENDATLREYGLTSEGGNTVSLIAHIANNVKQIYSLPHPILLKMDPSSDDSISETPKMLCLGACIIGLYLAAIILIDNTHISLSRISSLESYINDDSELTITSCITSSGHLLFGIFQVPETLLIVEANESSTPQTYNISQIFTNELQDDGVTYTDPKEFAVLGLFDGKFVILACYTQEYNSTIIIYNIEKEQVELKTTVTAYITGCTVTPYCPTPCDFFFNIKFLNREDIVSMDFFILHTLFMTIIEKYLNSSIVI